MKGITFLMVCCLAVGAGFSQAVTEEIPLVKGIRFEKSSDNEEKVFFDLNGFYPPDVFPLPGGKPRVVCDFINGQVAKEVSHYIKTDGNFIKLIRIGVHAEPPAKVRVVLDLDPTKSYDIEQIFKKENTFALIVRSEIGAE